MNETEVQRIRSKVRWYAIRMVNANEESSREIDIEARDYIRCRGVSKGFRVGLTELYENQIETITRLKENLTDYRSLQNAQGRLESLYISE